MPHGLINKYSKKQSGFSKYMLGQTTNLKMLFNKEGRKLDTNKNRWDLLPYREVEGVVKVLTLGAVKYSPDNWIHVPDPKNRYFAACMRHLVAWRKGEQIDSESKLSHLYHAICCLLFLAWFDNNKQEAINNDRD